MWPTIAKTCDYNSVLGALASNPVELCEQIYVEAMGRGWEDRDSSFVLTLQRELKPSLSAASGLRNTTTNLIKN